MTALTAHAIGPKVYVIGDTAAYDLDGVVGAFVSKVLAIPHLRMVIATRGSVMALSDIATALMIRCQSFDDVLENAAEVIQDTYHDRLLLWHDLCGEAGIDVMIAGYSERERRGCVGFMSSRENPQFAAFELCRLPVMLSPAVPEEHLIAAGILHNGAISTRQPAADMLRIIEMQRSVRHEIVAGDPDTAHHTVGGSAVLTEITEAGISQRVVKTWPDKIGERVKADPLPDIEAVGSHSVHASGAGMSRQQRRQAEKLARRAARVA